MWRVNTACWPRLPEAATEHYLLHLSPSSTGIVLKRTWTYCSAHYLVPSTTDRLLFFCHFSHPVQFPPSAPSPSLLPSFSPISLFLSPFLLGPCCPRGVWDAVMAWALELRTLWWCWGLFFLFVGLYTSHTAAYTYTDIHIQAHSWKISALIFPTQENLFYPLPQFDVELLLLSRYCKVTVCSIEDSYNIKYIIIFRLILWWWWYKKVEFRVSQLFFFSVGHQEFLASTEM